MTTKPIEFLGDSLDALRSFPVQVRKRYKELMRGKIDLFSLSTLMDMATAAGLEPRIAIKKPRACCSPS